MEFITCNRGVVVFVGFKGLRRCSGTDHLVYPRSCRFHDVRARWPPTCCVWYTCSLETLVPSKHALEADDSIPTTYHSMCSRVDLGAKLERVSNSRFKGAC